MVKLKIIKKDKTVCKHCGRFIIPRHKYGRIKCAGKGWYHINTYNYNSHICFNGNSNNGLMAEPE